MGLPPPSFDHWGSFLLVATLIMQCVPNSCQYPKLINLI